ncbi:MAG: glucosylceramidase [Blautia sp.]|nr:glucosylceramidase [Blautia sp.]
MKDIKKIITCEAEGKLWEESAAALAEQEDVMHVLNLYPQVKYQTIEGFGGAFTEASAHNYMGMGEEKRKELVEAYFGESGLRYNIGRVHMNSCDFGLGNYTYIKEGDETLESFDISRDEAEILPLVRAAVEAQKQEKMVFFVSPWSPPAFMKTNGEMNHGGQLKKEYYPLWAQYFVKFIRAYREKGVNITALTVQNEPAAVQTWDSCIYSASEEAEFVADHLGPALEAAGLSDVEIFVWDHNKEILFDRFSGSMENPKAAGYIKGAAVHWYTGDHFEAIEMVKKCYPGAKVIFSEGCVEYSRFADTRETYKAEMYAHDMLGNLVAGITSWLDWNLFLDEKGGPNHVGNFCAAPIMCNPAENTFEKRLTYYYIGQFSRYVQKGAVRIGSTRYTTDLELVAFENPDKSRVAVVLNRTDAPKEIELCEGESRVHETIPGHCIVTYVIA